MSSSMFRMLSEIADTNPESLSATTKPNFRFWYIDIRAVNCGFVNWNAVEELIYKNAPSRARRLVKTGDVLFGTVRPNLQSHGFLDANQLDNLVASTGFSVIRAKEQLAYPGYLFHCVMSNQVKIQAEIHAIGSNYPAVNDGDVRRFNIFAPSIKEQVKIAQILDTLDTTIRQTEAIIAKLQQVKQGLLHDLLTRGIDANGQLRPPVEQAPHLYKESPLGWIPREWEVVTLGDVAKRSNGLLQTGPFGSQLHAHDYVTEGVPVIMPQDMVEGLLSEAQIARISERKANVLGRHRVKENDIVLSRRGDLSRCVAISTEKNGWLCGTGCLLARFSPKEINGYWLALVYQQPHLQTQVMGRAVGSTMANLNTSILSELVIGRSSIEEQDEIARQVNAANRRLTEENRKLRKLHKQKSALMDDLLTGRVRVTALLSGETPVPEELERKSA